MKSFSKVIVWLGVLVLAVTIVVLMIVPVNGFAILETLVAGTMVLVGAWIGLDLKAVGNLTHSLPDGQFVMADTSKYISVLIALFIVIGMLVALQAQGLYDYTIPLATLAGSWYAVAGVFVSGMKKIKTETGVKENSASVKVAK